MSQNDHAVQAQGSFRILRHLMPYLSRYRTRVWLAVAALLIAAGVTLAVPVAFRAIIDQGFASEAGLAAGTPVDLAFLVLFALAVLLAISTALRFYCVSWLGERVTTDLRNDVFAQVLRQDPRFFETLKTGEVLSRLSSDTTLIQSLIGSSLSLGLRNSLLFVGALTMMIVTSPSLAMIIVALLVLVVLPILVFGRKVRNLSRDSQDRLADTGALAGETLGAIQIVQAYVREGHESSHYAKATEQAFESGIRRNRSRALLTLVSIILVFAAIVSVLWVGARAVMGGDMSAGLLTQFMLYAALVGGTAGVIAEVFGDVQRAAGATERLIELLEAQPSIVSGAGTAHRRQHSNSDSASASSHASTPFGAVVRFKAISFAYPSRPDEQSVDSLNIDIGAGETVALVGPSGAGKSTVFQLLLRFYDPQTGHIELDGTPLPDYSLDVLRSRIGLVAQDNVVFSVNAMENIRYGRLDASDSDVIAAARAAQAHEFIEKLPEGYNTYLGERGVRLSGGQRQRIAIARALLKNPPLLLLDEATSALDTESEHRVQLALEQAMSGRTTLVIAHRLATVAHADRILVMEEGRIVETGTHKELLELSGRYARLAALQLADGAQHLPGE